MIDVDAFGTTISNLVKNQFPEYYREQGPIFVSLVTEYYKWLETQSPSRDEWFVDKATLVQVQNRSANVVGLGASYFTVQFAKGDQIAVSKGSDTTDYDLFTVKSVANDSFLTLTEDRLPDFSHANTRYATVSSKPNALFLTRNFPDLNDIDQTLDQFVVYFKEKYLKNIQFKTITDTKTLVKHSLDLYRSKGTERSIDLLYKVVFGKPASVYYPGQDIFRLSSGDWFIPQYIELTLSQLNKHLINKEIRGVLTGTTAFVEEIIRRTIGSRVIEVAYISNIRGTFLTGEKVTLNDDSLDIEPVPTIVGSLNELEIDIAGAGANFLKNEIVSVNSRNGRGGLGKVLDVSNTIGLLTYDFIDGGYGYSNSEQLSNTIGNVSVLTACTIITGTGTFFQNDYSVGDYISIWENTANYKTGQVTVITSNTELQTDTPLTFTNTATVAAYTRYFAQTFISEKILTIANVVYDSDFVSYEYASWLDDLIQPTAVLSYENATGPFANGEHVFTYELNDDPKGEGVILNASKRTISSGVLTVSIVSGDLNDPAIYTESNVITANLSVVNGYTDTTATANIIGNYANVTLTCNGMTGQFANGEILIQPATLARGTILNSLEQNANTEVVIRLANTQGIFRNGWPVLGSNSAVSADPMNTRINMGVVDISNTFSVREGNYVSTGDFHGTVTAVSTGTGSQVIFSNNILYSEDVTMWLDRIYPLRNNLLGDATWPFMGNPSANLASAIGNTLVSNTLTLGKVQGIVSTSPGSDYTAVPIIKLHEPTSFSFDHWEEFILHVDDTSGFTVGKTVTQEATNARGIITDKDLDTLTVQNMKFHPENWFVDTGNTTTVLYGEASGFTSNISSIDEHTMSRRIGDNVTVNTNVIAAAGSITSVKILDSGFAFLNGEEVSILSGDKTATGYAVLNTHGTGSGYYKSSDGFLSDVKKLSDGYYYQEYSYEVQSAVIDDFKKILKNIVHVAGTKYFDALIYDSINTLESNTQVLQQISFSDLFRLKNAEDCLLLRSGNVLNLGHGTQG